MTKGDRVRRTDTGATGTVTRDRPDIGRVAVKWDDAPVTLIRADLIEEIA